MTTLSDFKRLPVGTKLRLNGSTLPNHKNMGTTREIEHKQSNAIRFVGGSWLQYPKASEITFINGNGQNLIEINSEGIGLLYELIK